MAAYYFAYGSNMNPLRVTQRGMSFHGYEAGVLQDYVLAFNKRSVKYPGAASANVVARPGDAVEGVLYELAGAAGIEKMDPFEGYPVRYSRFPLPVRTATEQLTAWVYVANPAFIQEGLAPARWYLAHLLAGADHLSPAYLARLQSTRCLPDSDVEPL